jgi:hypothetical protein
MSALEVYESVDGHIVIKTSHADVLIEPCQAEYLCEQIQETLRKIVDADAVERAQFASNGTPAENN